MDKNNRKLKIANKYKKANTSVTWELCCTYQQLQFSYLNRSKNIQTGATQKSLAPTFSENRGLRKNKSGEWAKSRNG